MSLDAWATTWIAPNIRGIDLDLEILTHIMEAKVAYFWTSMESGTRTY